MGSETLQQDMDKQKWLLQIYVLRSTCQKCCLSQEKVWTKLFKVQLIDYLL